MTNTVSGVFGAGTITTGTNPSNDYATGGWTAFVVDPNPSFQFLGQGTMSTSASNITASTSTENSSVQQLTIEVIPNGTLETQSAAAAQDDSFQSIVEQVPFFVYGYRSSPNTVTFADTIVQGL